MLLLFIIIWVVWVVLVWTMQHRLMFPRGMIGPDRLLANVPPGVESIWLDTDDGERVEAWLIPAEGASADQPAGAVVFTHGNAEVIDDNLDLRWLTELGLHVLLVEYRGYGRSTGSPSQRVIVPDTIAFVEQLRQRPDVDPDRIAYLGRSIGCSVLAQVALQEPPKAMLMMVPPSRLDSMAWRFGVPPFMVRSPFRSDLAVQELDVPLLLLPRDQDSIIPASHAPRLHELASQSTLIMLKGNHNWLESDDEMRRERQAIESTLRDSGVLTDP